MKSETKQFIIGGFVGLIILLIFLVKPVSATSNIDIDLDTTEDLNANIDLEADGNMEVYVNGQQLASKEYITSLGQGGSRNRMTEIFVDAINRIRDGTIFNPRVHQQTAIIGQALLTTFITRSEDDMNWMYNRFRDRLAEDIASGEFDKLVESKQEKRKPS